MSNPSHVKKPSHSQSTAFDPWLLWVALRRHWAWVIPAGVVMAAAGSYAVLYTFVPEFEATHILQANQDFVLSKDLTESQKDLAKNERPLIMSPLVLGEVLGLPELRSVPSLSNPNTAEFEIRKRLKISNSGADNLLTISFRDVDRNQVAKVANAVAESFKNQRRLLEEKRLKNIETSLAQPIETWRRNVAEARNQWVELSKKLTGSDPFKNPDEGPEGASYLGGLRGKFVEWEVEESALSARLVSLQAGLDQSGDVNLPVDPREIQAYLDRDRDVLQLRTKLADNQAEIRSIERKEQEGMLASRYKTLKKEVTSLQTQLATLESETREKAQRILREEHARRQQQAIQDVQAQIENLKVKRETFSADYDQEKDRLGKFSGETTELYLAREHYNREREVLDKLSNRLVLLKAERGRGPSINTLSMAQDPNFALEETPIKKMGMVGGIAFLFPFAIALLLEFLAKRITNAEAVDSTQLIPIMGEIVRIPSGRKRSLGQRMFEESVDALRANLLFKMESVGTIAVTSAMAGEGKSNIAYQLALSIARYTGERVLVIDADLRSPDQHELFGLELGPGLCKLLNGRAELDECIDHHAGELVHLLSAGRLDANPHNLLTKKNLEVLLEKVRGRYRYIVVDTAPVLPAAETLTITAGCDATLLCAMRDVSQSEHVKRTFRRLEASGSNVIGTVFSGVPSREYAARYGDYRYAKTSGPEQENIE